MKRAVKLLSVLAACAAIISSITGLFYSFGGQQRTVSNIYGQALVLLGDGIYANDTLLKAGATKGTDIVMLLLAAAILVIVFVCSRKPWARLLHIGLLACLLYSSTCLVMGVSYNRLFVLYLLQFSSSLFAFVISLSASWRQECFQAVVYQKKQKGIAAFLMLGGCSVLIWLTLIIPALLSGKPTGFIEIYTTEPTFVIDLGLIFPTCIYCGIMLLRQEKAAYLLASVLMTLVACVGLCVIAQTIMQRRLGIVLNTGQLIGMVVSFIVLGVIAVALNVRLLRRASKEEI